MALATPLRLVKKLAETAEIGPSVGISVRRYRGPEDIARWLSVHQAAFRTLLPPGRPWTKVDFEREFIRKPAWRDDAMWLAEAAGVPVGTITATPSPGEPTIATIRWLAVVPEFQRQGVASDLLRIAERASFQRGCTHALLETLPSWEAAIHFYSAHGYARTG